MAKLNDFYIKSKIEIGQPTFNEWSIIDPTGGGDFLTINEAWDAGRRNWLLSEGVHYMTADIDVDVGVSREPIRFIGQGEDKTRLQVNDGTTMYRFVVVDSTSYSSYYDYTVDPPVALGEQTNTVTFPLGSNEVTADNFTWSSLGTAYNTAPVVGDCISVNAIKTLYRITEIKNDTVLVVDEHNTYETYDSNLTFAISNEVLVEMKDLSFGVYDNPAELLPNGNDIFDNSSISYRMDGGIKYDIKNVDGLLSYNDGLNNATWANDGISTGCYLNNLRLPGG